MELGAMKFQKQRTTGPFWKTIAKLTKNAFKFYPGSGMWSIKTVGGFVSFKPSSQLTATPETKYAWRMPQIP